MDSSRGNKTRSDREPPPRSGGKSRGSSRHSKGEKKESGVPRFYGSTPVQHVKPGRGDGRRPNRRGRPGRRSSSPPVALLVGIPLGIVFIIGGLVLFSGDGPKRPAPRDVEPTVEVRSTAPAATAAPEREPAAAEPRRDDSNDGMRDTDGDGEESEAEIKERLEAIRRVRAAEQELFGEGRKGGDEDEDREVLDETGDDE